MRIGEPKKREPIAGLDEKCHGKCEEELVAGQSTCSQLVDKLVRAGLLVKTRGSDDQRRVLLSVTGRGQRTLARSPGPAEGVLPEAIAELSQAELVRLHGGLQKKRRSIALTWLAGARDVNASEAMITSSRLRWLYRRHRLR